MAQERSERVVHNSALKPGVLQQAIALLVEKRWSPEQISAYLKKREVKISKERIYQEIRTKIFSNDKQNVALVASKIISKFASYTNLLKMEVVKLNRIKAVLAETDKQGKWLAQQLGKDPTTVSKWCTNTIQPDLKTLAEIAEILNVNIRELLVNTK